MRTRLFLSLFLSLAVIAIGLTAFSKPQPVPVTNPTRQLGPVRAPEFNGGLGWLNTNQPLTLAGLRGKVVVLDFWTFCCINCMHVIPDLKYLEAKFPNELVVIGVHSAKFENEKDTENIRRAIARYEVTHPVVNDANFKIWDSYGVRAWPTFVVIDPEGYVTNMYSGEGHRNEVEAEIRELVEEAKKKGKLKPSPLSLSLEQAKLPDTPLLFPGKITADEATKRLFISDSNHNRIVITNFDGMLLDVIGSGSIGDRDGDYAKAQFHHPQGMALDGDSLYVADTENHLIRRVDLKNRKVETVAGSGEQGHNHSGEAPGREISLASPWDVIKVGSNLYIAMAGTHQIWKYSLKTGVVSWFAGSGAEGRLDADLKLSAFAQPSGLATDGKELFVADSEISSIRAINLESGTVRTVAGGDLFDFGDVDAVGDSARFQHPLGVAYADGKIYVADTYNHKIRVVDPATGNTWSLTKGGADRAFLEPGGIAFAGGKLFVADTNAQRVRVVAPASRTVSTLAIAGLTSPASAEDTAETLPNLDTVKLEPRRVARGGGDVILDVTLPEGYHLNEETPHRYKMKTDSGAIFLKPEKVTGSSPKLKFPLKIPYIATTEGTATLTLDTTFFYCRDKEACAIRSVRFIIPVEVTKDGGKRVDVKYNVVKP